ncbi:P-loop containing nucleoside triphosphate hydrolase protein [Neurospora hispaniola]|uniref:P-loop containing nucleoside triphosphate hydrolase protein n=1 Tax=Neurospora hispaniola TaxID=588809 RepID=A0AAJ0MRG9_9PEZI|nr:P-loop containing nucleoside triphosphate hydrolase protein [Neurospora hispaniola]
MARRTSHRMGPSDVVILVMGMTGSGKSQFVSKLTGENAGVGHSLTAGTVSLDLYSCVENGQRIFVADTPGFNDTQISDVEILKDIAFFLGQLHLRNVRLGGILYLHSITDNRVSGSALRTFNMLRALCGPQALNCAALVTTKWGALRSPKDDLAACDRENELMYTSNFWGSMRQHGSQSYRWLGSEASARSIVREVIQTTCRRTSSPVLQIQRELIDEKRPLDSTSAGREMMKRYEDRCQKVKQELDDLRSELLSASGLTREELKEGEAEVNRLMNELSRSETSQQGLRVSQRDLFEQKTGEYKQLYQGIWEEVEQEDQMVSEIGGREQRLSHLEPKRDSAKGLATAENPPIPPRAGTWARVGRFLKRNVLPLLGVLAGVGVVAAGAAVISPPLIMAGAQLLALSFAGVQWHTGQGADGPDLIAGVEGVIRACPPTPITAGFRMHT